MSRLDLAGDPVLLTRQLCDIASVSGEEKQLADAIFSALRSHPHLEVHRDGDAVIARTQLGRAARVVLAGHIDTVPIRDNLPVRAERVAGVDYLVGRGAVDMKGGLAVLLHLAATVTTPRVDLTLICYDHEEVEAAQNGLGRIARNHPEFLVGDFAIVGEPSAAEIEGGCNGVLRVQLRAQGTRAHVARAWRGENAIHRLAGALERLAQYRAETVSVDGLEYRESLSAVAIRGGVAGNVVPDEAIVELNYRFAPAKSSDEAERWLREFFSDYELSVVDRAEGARPGLDHPLVAQFVAATGTKARPKYGWTDVARFAALGVPGVNYGPGDPSLAHADDERVAVAEIDRCVATLRGWLASDD